MLLYLLIGFLTYNVKKERVGSVCCDDSKSGATGSGACSNHGGVREWVVQYHYENYEEPYNTLHKFFYFWYAIDKDHTELDYESDCGEDLPYEPLGPGR